MQRASISSRFSAMNLDMIIFGALWQGLSMVFERVTPELATAANSIILCFFAAVLYFVYPTKVTGQTLGKKLLSLKVVPVAGAKVPVTWGQAFLREIVGKSLGTIPLWLGYIWAYTNPQHKAWHDSLSKTYVISLIWEEEKTSLQKLQHVMLGILSIPLGVALILGIFLYTSLPLDSIKEKIEASGIQVGALTGSLAGGLHFSQISRQGQDQSFSLGAVDVKFNLSALAYDHIFIIEKLTAEEGHIEVPGDFSWLTIFVNLMAIGQNQEQGLTLGNFKMGKLNLKNISFEHDKKIISQLQEFAVKNLEMADKELRIAEAQFQIGGLMIKAQDFKSAFGRIEVASATGGIGPEFLPILKVPVDFHVKGSLGKNPRASKIEGGMMIDKIKFAYENEKITVTVDKLLLNEMFKTALPLEDLDLRLSAQGENTLQMMSSLNVEYGIKVCGSEFKADAEEGSILAREDRQFSFKMVPKPVPDFGRMIFAKDVTLDDLFFYELRSKKMTAPAFASHQEMVADLCFKKDLASLQPPERDILQSLEKAANAVNTGGSLQAMLASAVPITVTKTISKPVATEILKQEEKATPAAVSLQGAIIEARNLLRLGRYAEAKNLLEAMPLVSEDVPAAELGAFYNLKAWVYLFSNEPAEAAQTFELAFNARKDVGDAEGLLKANEALKKDQEVRKWLDYIKAAIKENPDLKNHLTPNTQKKITSEEDKIQSSAE